MVFKRNLEVKYVLKEDKITAEILYNKYDLLQKLQFMPIYKVSILMLAFTVLQIFYDTKLMRNL
jgi:hypothetical protein